MREYLDDLNNWCVYIEEKDTFKRVIYNKIL